MDERHYLDPSAIIQAIRIDGTQITACKLVGKWYSIPDVDIIRRLFHHNQPIPFILQDLAHELHPNTMLNFGDDLLELSILDTVSRNSQYKSD